MVRSSLLNPLELLAYVPVVHLGEKVMTGAQLFTIGGTAVGAMFNSPAAKTARFWLYYFNVGDIDAAAKRVGDGGGKIMHGPQQVPGGGWIVQAADPQGAAFALLGSRK